MLHAVKCPVPLIDISMLTLYESGVSHIQSAWYLFWLIAAIAEWNKGVLHLPDDSSDESLAIQGGKT